MWLSFERLPIFGGVESDVDARPINWVLVLTSFLVPSTLSKTLRSNYPFCELEVSISSVSAALSLLPDVDCLH
jgi:hypothetical protein